MYISINSNITIALFLCVSNALQTCDWCVNFEVVVFRLMKMSVIRVSPCLPGVYASPITSSQLRRRDFNSRPRSLPMMAFDPLSVASLSLRAEPSPRLQCQPALKSRRPLLVCFAASGQGMMENNRVIIHDDTPLFVLHCRISLFCKCLL